MGNEISRSSSGAAESASSVEHVASSSAAVNFEMEKLCDMPSNRHANTPSKQEQSRASRDRFIWHESDIEIIRPGAKTDFQSDEEDAGKE